MADNAFLRQAPLDRLALSARTQETLGEAGLGLGEIRFQGAVNLRARRDDEAARQALTAALGSALPGVNATATAGELTVIGLGPDEWLAVGGDSAAVAARLGQAVQGVFVGVTDVGENYATLRLQGPAARRVLAKGCPLDLALFRPGDAAQSLLAKASVVLRQLPEGAAGEAFEVLVRRSFAEYLFRWLEDAGREYGVAILQA